MKKLIVILSVSALIIMGIVLLRGCSSEEKVIKRNLKKLAQVVSKNEGDSHLALIADCQYLQRIFVQDCEVSIEYEGIPAINNRNQLLAVYQNMFRLVDSLNMKFYDISVDISEPATEAQTHMTVLAEGIDPNKNEKVNVAREVEISWVKDDGEWKIKSARAIETLH